MQFDVDFEPFAGDPLLLGAAARRPKRKRMILMLPVVCLTTLVVIQLVFLDHAQGTFAGRLCADLRAFIAISPADSGSCVLAKSTEIPLRRDFATLFAAIVLSVTPWFTWKMWDGYGRLISHMVTRGSITIKSRGAAVLKREIKDANKDVQKIGNLASATMLLMGVALSQLMAQQAHSGVFDFLGSGSSNPNWGREAYLGWWASDQHSYGHIIYFVVGTWGLYLLTQQNLVGLRFIWLFWRTRQIVSFGADPINSDGFYGWEAVRQSLGAVYAMLAIHGLALACVVRMMPASTLIGPIAVAWLQWVLVLPLYLAFPFFFVREKISKYKKMEISRLEASAAAIGPALSEHERIAAENTIATRIATIREIPTLPFKSLQDSAIFLISLIADTAAVIAILISYLGSK